MSANRLPVLSAYLVTPNLTRRRYWRGFRTQLMELKRVKRRRLPRATIVGLILWVAVIWFGQWAWQNQTLAAPIAAAVPGPNAVAEPTPGSLPTATLSSVNRVTSLTSGPTGDLLPPGTLAPDRTYRNSYSWGQCTWYVAGRRPIPAGWGNANQWYYHAISSGWKVGTVPAVGAIAWTGAGYYGHVALVEQISPNGRSLYVSEMNYIGLGKKSYRWAPSSSFRYIY